MKINQRRQNELTTTLRLLDRGQELLAEKTAGRKPILQFNTAQGLVSFYYFLFRSVTG